MIYMRTITLRDPRPGRDMAILKMYLDPLGYEVKCRDCNMTTVSEMPLTTCPLCEGRVRNTQRRYI